MSAILSTPITTKGVTEEEAWDEIEQDLMTPKARKAFRTTKLFRESNTPWGRGYNSAKKIGSVMDSIRALPDDATVEDWEDYYLSEIRSITEVYWLIDDFAFEQRYTWQDAINIWWSRVIDQTWQGWQDEIAIKHVLEKKFKGITVEDATDIQDRKYGVDLVLYHTDNRGRKSIWKAIQVKRRSYFTGYSWQLTKEREVINPAKNRAFYELEGVKVYYITIEDALAGDVFLIDPDDAAKGREALNR